MSSDLYFLESSLGYTFQDKNLLESALTHKSYGYEEDVSSLRWADNERLEFLGDAVLELIVSELLMERAPDKNEGELSRLRAALVNEGSLASIALKIGLHKHLRLGKGEEKSGGRDKPSILADALEAVVAALYFDAGIDEIRKFVTIHFEEFFNEISHIDRNFDFKTRLQEVCQKDKKLLPMYKVVKEEGPDHQKIFEVEVFLDGKKLAFGSGRSKKEAEQMAASSALEGIGNGI